MIFSIEKLNNLRLATLRYMKVTSMEIITETVITLSCHQITRAQCGLPISRDTYLVCGSIPVIQVVAWRCTSVVRKQDF